MALKWYDDNANNPPWIKALADVRRTGTLEGHCFHHVQAIRLAIDQYAENRLGQPGVLLKQTAQHRREKLQNPLEPMDKNCPICFGVGWICAHQGRKIFGSEYLHHLDGDREPIDEIWLAALEWPVVVPATNAD
jgi:hypothetical protein